jgi:ferredoxin-NADP reductase
VVVIVAGGTAHAPFAAMTQRTFRARDGTAWVVWHVERSAESLVPGTPQQWLAFQDDKGEQRRRLFEVPDNWDVLPDERLDLLRRVAQPAMTWGTLSPPGGIERAEEADER